MAPTKIHVVGVWTLPDGTPARGEVHFLANNAREDNGDTTQDRIEIVKNLDAGGAIAIDLVINVGGYTVTEIIGKDPVSYVITCGASGTTLDLATVDPQLAQLGPGDLGIFAVPSGGATGSVLAKLSGSDGDYGWVDPTTGAIPVTLLASGVTSYTVLSTDQNHIIVPTAPSAAVALHVPTGLPAGFYGARADGAGKVSFVGVGGAIVNGVGGAVGTRVQFSEIGIVPRRPDIVDSWIVTGDAS